MTIGAPPQNYSFVSTSNIAPSWHIGPRAYSVAGIIPHPLQLVGAVPQLGAGNEPGAAGIGPMGQSAAVINLQAFPHAFTINGRAPG